MRASFTALLPLALLAACSQAPVKPEQAAPQQTAMICPPGATCLVKVETSLGDITVQLDAKRAPLSVQDFLSYVTENYYDGAAFYRVIPGFVIQAGEFSPEFDYRKPSHPDVPNESGNGLPNQRGSIAMAREEDPHSANSVFYINVGDNSQRLGPRPDRWGYAVFGQVVAGMDVVDKIVAVPTHTVTLTDKDHSSFENVPVQPVKILKVSLLPVSSKP
jgi:peptidyl-prolyl cis-trans isomerase A (cyclophilin A)